MIRRLIALSVLSVAVLLVAPFAGPDRRGDAQQQGALPQRTVLPGEIWLSSSNFLVDRGIATAAETGVYGPEGQWLIEGHGVDPDIVVDNLPNATFKGGDAQLDAAVKYVLELIKTKPVPVPPPPPYPIKSGAPEKK